MNKKVIEHSKEELRVHKVTYYTVSHFDLESFINYQFKLDNRFEFALDQMCRNDSVIVIVVNGKIDAYDKDRLNDLEESMGDECYMAEAFMNKLAQDGKISKGKYLIEVSW